MHELIGATIAGRYTIQERLARGGMSEVYLARTVGSEEVVAVKLVHNSSEENCKRFMRETRAIAWLKHEHILPILACGEYDPWRYMVTPYIEDGTLHELLARGPLGLEEAGAILSQLADALQCAHDHGVVHRDIKPSNVLLGKDRHVYLADFGLVKGIQGDHGVTQSGYIIGTPEYLAPELVEGVATASSDVYALGVLLYHMVSGRVPFKASSPIAVVWKHLCDEPEPPSTLNPRISPLVERVVLRALAKNPTERFQTTSAFSRAYQQALRGEACSEIMAGAPFGQACDLPVTRVLERKPLSRRRKLLLGAIAACLLGVLYVVPVVFGLMASSNQVAPILFSASIAEGRARHNPVTETFTFSTLRSIPWQAVQPSIIHPSQSHDSNYGGKLGKHIH